jgi:hypothetical protein
MRQPATGITQNLGNRNRKKDRTAVRFSSVLWIFSVHRTEPANTNKVSDTVVYICICISVTSQSARRPGVLFNSYMFISFSSGVSTNVQYIFFRLLRQLRNQRQCNRVRLRRTFYIHFRVRCAVAVGRQEMIWSRKSGRSAQRYSRQWTAFYVSFLWSPARCSRWSEGVRLLA